MAPTDGAWKRGASRLSAHVVCFMWCAQTPCDPATALMVQIQDCGPIPCAGTNLTHGTHADRMGAALLLYNVLLEGNHSAPRLGTCAPLPLNCGVRQDVQIAGWPASAADHLRSHDPTETDTCIRPTKSRHLIIVASSGKIVCSQQVSQLLVQRGTSTARCQAQSGSSYSNAQPEDVPLAHEHLVDMALFHTQ